MRGTRERAVAAILLVRNIMRNYYLYILLVLILLLEKRSINMNITIVNFAALYRNKNPQALRYILVHHSYVM